LKNINCLLIIIKEGDIKMVKVKLILITIVICGVFLLAGCGGNGKGSGQPSGVSNSPQNVHETEDKKEKTNAERFLEYVKEAAY